MTPGAAWWVQAKGSHLAQGDYLPNCLVPFFEPDYGIEGKIREVPVKEYDCLIFTQSCDLENNKAPLVALCPIHSISTFEEVTPALNKRANGREYGREGSKAFIFWHRMTTQTTTEVVS